MAKRSVCLMCLAAVALGVTNETSQNFLTDGSSLIELLRLEEDAQKIPQLTRNLVLETQACRAKLTDIVNDVEYAALSITYFLNQGVPSIRDKHLYDNVTHIADTLSKMANQVQHQLHGNSEKLKESLAGSIENGVVLVQALLELIRKSEYKDEIFIANQLRRFTSLATQSIVKAKLQVEFFKKTNKDLEHEIDAALEGFCKSLQGIRDDHPKVPEKFIYLIQHFEMVQNLAINKLENLININRDEQNVPIVREVIRGLKTHSSTFSQLTAESHDVAHTKLEFQKFYKVATNSIKNLLQVVVSENSPEQMYVRSILFDSIALSRVYEVEVRSF